MDIIFLLLQVENNGEYANPVEMTQKWLNKNKIYYDKLIVNAREKSSVCKNENIDLFIDDQLNNCLSISNVGIKTIMITDKIYNYDEITQLKNWNEIYEYIKKQSNKWKKWSWCCSTFYLSSGSIFLALEESILLVEIPSLGLSVNTISMPYSFNLCSKSFQFELPFQSLPTKIGGHFGPNFGFVEATIAMH